MFQTLTAALAHNFKNYATFRGRTSQRDYWLFITSIVAVTIACWLPSAYAPDSLRLALLWLPVIFFILPVITATVRRFRDADRAKVTYTSLSKAIVANLLHLALTISLVLASLRVAALIYPGNGDTWSGLGTLFVLLCFTLPIALIISALAFVPVVLLYRRSLLTTPAPGANASTVADTNASPAPEPVHPSLAVAAPVPPIAAPDSATAIPEPNTFNLLAVIAPILVLLSPLVFSPLAIVGGVLGIMAITQIRRNPQRGITAAYIAAIVGCTLFTVNLAGKITQIILGF